MNDYKDNDMKIEDVDLSPRAVLAAEFTQYEKSLTFRQTLRIFWRSTLWVAYGQLVVFGYGIDGIIAGYLLAVPQFRYAEKSKRITNELTDDTVKTMARSLAKVQQPPISFLQPGKVYTAALPNLLLS